MSERRNAILFDEETPDRPHLAAALERERQEVSRLRQELRKFWREHDEWRTLVKTGGGWEL